MRKPGPLANVKNRPTFCSRRKRWGTRKVKSRAKTSQVRDELAERVHRGRGAISKGKYGCEKVAHPPRLLSSEPWSSYQQPSVLGRRSRRRHLISRFRCRSGG
jgi:hypothetical protein